MGNAYQKAVGNRGLLDRLIGKLPGYGGYIDRDARQEADRIQRDFVANKLFGQKKPVAELMEELISEGEIGELDKYEKLQKRLDIIAQKIRAASYGSAGLFGASKIGEDELRRLHEFDLGLVEAAEEVELEIGRLTKALGDADKLKEARKAVLAVLDRVEDHFGKRAAIIKQG